MRTPVLTVMAIALTAVFLQSSLLMAADTSSDGKQYVGEVSSVIPYDDCVSLMLLSDYGAAFQLKPTTAFKNFQRSMVSTDAKQLAQVLAGTKVKFTVTRTAMGTLDVIAIEPWVDGQTAGKVVLLGRTKLTKSPSKEQVKLPARDDSQGENAQQAAPWMPEIPQIPQAPQVPVMPTPQGE